MAREYEVVIVDSPPLSAGADSYALASATGSLALVLRADITNRRMTKARLEVLATHPVRVIGAVLNGFTPASSARSV
jgi:Mrp family chromosome partitioning ATPase